MQLRSHTEARNKDKSSGIERETERRKSYCVYIGYVGSLLGTLTCLSCLLQNDEVSIDEPKNTVRRTKETLNNVDCDKEITQFKKENITDNVFRDVALKTEELV